MKQTWREIAFRVEPSPDSNDHQVRIIIDGVDMLWKHAPDMLGVDPEDILKLDLLASRKDSHEEIIARCACGVIGCGNATVQISQEADAVIWDKWGGDLYHRNPGTLTFRKNQYDEAVRTVLNDHSWEPPDRTAARLLRSEVNHEFLANYGLEYEWSSGRVKESSFTISLLSRTGQVLLNLSWQGESPEEIAKKAAELLMTDPQGWPGF